MKNSPKILLFRFLFAIVVALAVIAGSSKTMPTAAQATKAATMKVAVVLPGAINDQSWNSLGYNGLKAIEKKYGAEIAYSENVQPADQVDAIRDYVQRGFNVVFVHGGQFEDAALTVAKEAPNVTFFVTAGAKGNGANVIALDAARDQMIFGVSYLAAKMSKTGKIGYVTSLEGIPASVSAVCGFRAGGKAANPDAKISVVYLPDMEDVAKAREATLTLIGDGVDFVVGDLNRAIQGVLDVAKEKGVLTTGRVPDHTKIYPEGVMTMVAEDWANMYPSAVQQLLDGKLPKTPLFLGVDKGFYYAYTLPPAADAGTPAATPVQVLKLNPKVPADVAKAWQQAVDDVASGKITITKDDTCFKGGTK